jgi:hypothetical protein
MSTRRPASIFLAALLAGAVAIAGCGGSSSSGTSAADAKAAVEKAAGVKLTAFDIPNAGEAKKEGLEGAYSNAKTAIADKQAVFLFTVKDADTLNKVKDSLKSFDSTGKTKILSHDNVAVVYGAIGNDHSSDIQTALNGL